MIDAVSWIRRLEQYTLQNPQEVLLLTVDIDGQTDEILIFKGFSSSLMRPTAFDPDIPVLPENAAIHRIDRLESPYQPAQPRYIEQGLSLSEFEYYLAEVQS